MAVKIKLKRLGKIHAPYYRVVVADARAKRDGRAIEEIGKYHPKQEPSLIEINSERAQYWLSVGAQPTDPVRNLLEITGDWQRYRGEGDAAGTLKVAPPRHDKKEAFAAALKETHGDTGTVAATSKQRGRKAETKADRPARGGRPSRGDTADRADTATAGEETTGPAGGGAAAGREAGGTGAAARQKKPASRGGKPTRAGSGAARKGTPGGSATGGGDPAAAGESGSGA